MRDIRISEMSDREYNLYKKNRRTRALVKTNIIRLVIAFLLVISIVIGFRCASKKASATNRIESCKYYKTINMKFDQTLLDVAIDNYDEHYDSVEQFYNEIKAINHVTEDSAIAGGKLLYIPYYDIPEYE